MSTKKRILHGLDVLFRIPPLIVIDYFTNTNRDVVPYPWLPHVDDFSGWTYVLWFLVGVICTLFSVVVFVLPRRQLVVAYSSLLWCMSFALSFWSNSVYIQHELADDEYGDEPWRVITRNPDMFCMNVMIQISMAYLYNFLRQRLVGDSLTRFPWSLLRGHHGVETYLCFSQPTIWRLASLPRHYLQAVSWLSVIVMLLEFTVILIVHLWSLPQTIRRLCSRIRAVIRAQDLQMLLEIQWIRLRVPLVLRLFWIQRTVYHLGYHIVSNRSDQAQTEPGGYWTDLFVNILSLDNLLDIVKDVFAGGCESVISLLGMTSIVSRFIHYFGILMAAIVGSDSEEDQNMGTMSAILFFILALQTGLTGLDPDRRLVRLYRNFCLLSTAILHFIHSMVHPLLNSISASHVTSRARHARVLAVCAFLLGFPVCFLCYLWSHHNISTWLLAVTAFSIEVMIKVCISLLIYCLFMIDTYQETFWEQLDDYIYYIRATGNTIEFIFGLFLFGNGAWILLFESSGAIRAVMMCVHAYFNIWNQAKEGWKVFIKRRTAVRKINSLPEASAEQLQQHNDVCAICYQEIHTARVTRCNHFFHSVCLRKWLYVQDSCPLCHKAIYAPEQDDSVDGEHNGNVDNVPNHNEGGAQNPQ